MNCIECKHPMFEQFKGYKGRWYCFNPQHFKDQREGIVGKDNLICETPVKGDEYEPLRNAKTPAFCPFLIHREGGDQK